MLSLLGSDLLAVAPRNNPHWIKRDIPPSGRRLSHTPVQRCRCTSYMYMYMYGVQYCIDTPPTLATLHFARPLRGPPVSEPEHRHGTRWRRHHGC